MDFGFRAGIDPARRDRAAARRPRPRDPRRAGGADRHRLLGAQRHRRAPRRDRRRRATRRSSASTASPASPASRFEMDALGRRRHGRRLPEGADDARPASPSPSTAPRAEAARVPCPSPYWDWGPRIAPRGLSTSSSAAPRPTHHLYGLRAALDMILPRRGWRTVWARHARLRPGDLGGGGAWGAGGALALNIADRALRSHAVTTIRTGPGDAHAAAPLVRRDRRADARHRPLTGRGRGRGQPVPHRPHGAPQPADAARHARHHRGRAGRARHTARGRRRAARRRG